MTPAGWTGASLLLWAIASDQLLLVAPLAVALEAAALLSLRFDFERQQFERCADASSVIFAGVALYQFNVHALYGIYAILTLMPWCLLPLTLMQVYSTQRLTPLAALVYSLRRAGTTAQLDLRLALGLSALLAASAGTLPRPTYAAAVALSVGWLLWMRRPYRHQQARWLGAIAIATLLALALQTGYLRLHLLLGELAQDWFREMNLSPADIERTSTAIGSMRQLKLSDRIYLRVHTSSPLKTPLLLTEATYSEFRFGGWSKRRTAPVTVDADPGARRWRLGAKPPEGPRYDIAMTRRREAGVVPLPANAAQLAGDNILDVQQVAGDALFVEAPVGLLSYSVTTAADANRLAAAPAEADLTIPEEYRALISRVADEIGLPGRADASPRAAVERVHAHFARHFRYSLVQASSVPWRAPLATFLTVSHRGHCEYFASATVLLLRAAGIPARYAVGYAVDEYSPLEGAWLARARDAHAWAVAWIDSEWQVIDNTPAQWAALEDAATPSWQAWFDVASWIAFQWRRLQAGEATSLRLALECTAAALAGWLVWRQRRRLQRRRNAPPAAETATTTIEPSLALLLARLARRGSVPASGETTARFLRRQLPPTCGDVHLDTLIALHYAARFGGRPLSAIERARLDASVAAYLQLL